MIFTIVGAVVLFVILIVTLLLPQRAQAPYRILVLGSSGAGKTVFLASMYYKLSTLNPETGFFLVTDEELPEQEESLRKYQALLTNKADTDFSAPTLLKELSEWKFICKVRRADATYSVMRFSYYDYAGERIKNLFNVEKYTQQFKRVINEADVLLAMLDGQEVLKLMRGEENNFEEEFVNYIIPILTNSTQPVHFLITKWDLLQKHYSLDEVRSHLMRSSPRFRDFVEEQRSFGILRLIPVSAVGLNFAELDPDGTMLKKSDAKFEPYQVEMPIVSAIFDQLDYASKKVGFVRQGWFAQLKRNGVIRGPVKLLLLFVAWMTTAVTVNIGVFALAPGIFTAGIVEYLGHTVIRSPAQTDSGKLAAAKQLIERTGRLLRKLEKEFPESNLTIFKKKAHS